MTFLNKKSCYWLSLTLIMCFVFLGVVWKKVSESFFHNNCIKVRAEEKFHKIADCIYAGMLDGSYHVWRSNIPTGFYESKEIILTNPSINTEEIKEFKLKETKISVSDSWCKYTTNRSICKFINVEPYIATKSSDPSIVEVIVKFKNALKEDLGIKFITFVENKISVDEKNAVVKLQDSLIRPFEWGDLILTDKQFIFTAYFDFYPGNRMDRFSYGSLKNSSDLLGSKKITTIQQMGYVFDSWNYIDRFAVSGQYLMNGDIESCHPFTCYRFIFHTPSSVSRYNMGILLSANSSEIIDEHQIEHFIVKKSRMIVLNQRRNIILNNQDFENLYSLKYETKLCTNNCVESFMKKGLDLTSSF